MLANKKIIKIRERLESERRENGRKTEEKKIFAKFLSYFLSFDGCLLAFFFFFLRLESKIKIFKFKIHIFN